MSTGGDFAALEAMAELTERLTRLLTDQVGAFERHRPQDAAPRLAELGRLVALYQAGAAKLRSDDTLLAKAPPKLRQRLLAATQALEAARERHDRVLSASKTITEGLVRAVAEAVAAKRASNSGYGPGSARRTAATAITLNRSA